MKRMRNRKDARMSGGNCSREMERPAEFPPAVPGEGGSGRALLPVLLRLGLMVRPAALAPGRLRLGRGRTGLRRRAGLRALRSGVGAAVGPGLRPRRPGGRLVDRLGAAGPAVPVGLLRAVGLGAVDVRPALVLGAPLLPVRRLPLRGRLGPLGLRLRPLRLRLGPLGLGLGPFGLRLRPFRRGAAPLRPGRAAVGLGALPGGPAVVPRTSRPAGTLGAVGTITPVGLGRAAVGARGGPSGAAPGAGAAVVRRPAGRVAFADPHAAGPVARAAVPRAAGFTARPAEGARLEGRAVERGARTIDRHRAHQVGGQLRLAGDERGHVRDLAAVPDPMAIALPAVRAIGADVEGVEHGAVVLPGVGTQRPGVRGDDAPLQAAAAPHVVDGHGVALHVAVAVPIAMVVAAPVAVPEIAGAHEIPAVEEVPVAAGPAVDAPAEAEAGAEAAAVEAGVEAGRAPAHVARAPVPVDPGRRPDVAGLPRPAVAV